MKMMIHDLTNEDFTRVFPYLGADTLVVAPEAEISPCIGCFGCWVKTPGACVIRDAFGDMGAKLGKSDEVVIISRCFYGGFSPFVKNVLDRSISYIHPYFRIVDNEMHHRQRYNRGFKMRVGFYGEGITSNERKTAQRLVKMNAVNLLCIEHTVSFAEDASDFAKGHM